MSKAQYLFSKDTTSRLLDGDIEHHPLSSKGSVVLLVALSATSVAHSQFIESCLPVNNKPRYIQEWKFDSAKRISLATESVRLQKRLVSIIDLCADDEDMLPIGNPAIRNMKLILQDAKDSLLKGWNLFPNNNGTLSLERKDKTGISAIISVGYDMISYSITKGEQMHIIGKEPFSFDAIETILEKLA